MIITKPILFLLAGTLAIALLTGCHFAGKRSVARMDGESLVFIGEERAALSHVPVSGKPLSVRSTYLRDAATIHYLEGQDFIVDYADGTLRRTPGSRLPDFRTNNLYGKEEFDHTQFPGFGNAGYFAFVDYAYVPSAQWPVQASQEQFLRKAQSKLKSGGTVKIVAYGDSITAGGDASRPELIFWRRWADDLQQKYPRARISAVNGATGGDSTVQGLQRLQAKVLNEKPDLVLIGFGMNDHNANGVPIPRFEENLKEMITRIRSETSADIVLFSAFPPNPKWKFGTHRMADYAAATSKVARETSCACADVFRNWETLATRKKPEDLLGNNINHPNDFGHWIYLSVFRKLGL